MNNTINDLIYIDVFFKGKNELHIYYKSYEVKNSIATIVISQRSWKIREARSRQESS